METHASEVPFIPQIFGGDPGDMATAAEMLASTADIIDLNFGCPAPKVTNICGGCIDGRTGPIGQHGRIDR